MYFSPFTKFHSIIWMFVSMACRDLLRTNNKTHTHTDTDTHEIGYHSFRAHFHTRTATQTRSADMRRPCTTGTYTALTHTHTNTACSCSCVDSTEVCVCVCAAAVAVVYKKSNFPQQFLPCRSHAAASCQLCVRRCRETRACTIRCMLYYTFRSVWFVRMHRGWWRTFDAH